jgi:hypothetical protein
MTYTETAVTPLLLSALYARLWPRGVEEIRRVGITLADAYQSMLEWAKAGRSGVLLADGEPVLVCGIYPDAAGAFTWMAARDDFERHYRAMVRTMRHELAKWPGTVYIYSVCVDQRAERFFNALGCERDGWAGRTPTGAALYRFTRR